MITRIPRTPTPRESDEHSPVQGEFPLDRTLRDGTPALIWPLLPTDGPGLQLAWDQLSPHSRESRFLTPRHELGPDMLDVLVGEVDQRRHLAFVLVVLPPGGTDEVVGIGRLVQDELDPITADIAVTVRDDWQGRGVGSLLADALVQHRPAEVTRLLTVVAADNSASVAMLRRLGRTTISRGYPGVYDVRVELPPVASSRRSRGNPRPKRGEPGTSSRS